jgi:hypothetical protein
VTVEAKMEQTGGDGSRLYQEFSRKFTLPKEVDVENVKSLFSAQVGAEFFVEFQCVESRISSCRHLHH